MFGIEWFSKIKGISLPFIIALHCVTSSVCTTQAFSKHSAILCAHQGVSNSSRWEGWLHLDFVIYLYDVSHRRPGLHPVWLIKWLLGSRDAFLQSDMQVRYDGRPVCAFLFGWSAAVTTAWWRLNPTSGQMPCSCSTVTVTIRRHKTTTQHLNTD